MTSPLSHLRSGIVLVIVLAGFAFGQSSAIGQTTCQQTVSTVPAILNRANTVYCLSADVSGSGTVTLAANTITLNGQGHRFTGTVSISSDNRTGTIVKNVDVGPGAISITGGSDNQILDSRAGYLGVRQTTRATVRGNSVSSTGTQAIHVGDDEDVPTPAVWTEQAVIENNTFIGDGNTDARFIYFRHVRNSVFRNNTATLRNARFSVSGGRPTDNATLGVMYFSHANTLAGNTFLLDIAPSHETYRQLAYVGGALLIRSGSSNNTIENNNFQSDADRGIWIQSSSGAEHPENNIIRGNTILEHASALRIQAVKAGSQNNLFERNTIVATNGHAVETDGLQANARAVFDYNTIVTKSGDAIWGDGTDTSRRLIFTNNIISATGGYTFRLEGVTLTADYNDLRRTDAGGLVWWNGNAITNLASWQTGGRDINSISQDPRFISPTTNNYHLAATSPALTASAVGGSLGAYSTATSACVENWTCGNWSACLAGTQNRTCSDANACGTTVSRPAISQTCTIDPVSPPADPVAPPPPAETVSPPTSGSTTTPTITPFPSISNPLKCNTGQCLITTVIRSILGIIAALSTLTFVWGGLLMLTSAGNAQRVKQAKETLTYAAIGIVVILLGWSVIQFVIKGII